MGLSLFRQRELKISNEELRRRLLLRDPIEYIYIYVEAPMGRARSENGGWTADTSNDGLVSER